MRGSFALSMDTPDIQYGGARGVSCWFAFPVAN